MKNSKMDQCLSSAVSVKDAGQTHLAGQAENLHKLVTCLRAEHTGGKHDVMKQRKKAVSVVIRHAGLWDQTWLRH